VGFVNLFKVDQLAFSIWQLGRHQGVFNLANHKGEGGLMIPRENMTGVLNRLYAVKDACDASGFTDASNKFALTLSRLSDHSNRFDGTTLECEIRNLLQDVVLDILKHQFVQVHRDRVKYFEQEALFGVEVTTTFKRAAFDIRESGNCIALDLPTAAVFHLMRVAEHGIRRLAKRLPGVTLTHKGLAYPIEFGDWNVVLTAIRNKIVDVSKNPQLGPERQGQLELFSDAADHCTFMKDIWRNSVSHTRKPYIISEAIASLERVQGFMQFLARSLRRLR
jgi:hypothetical protein